MRLMLIQDDQLRPIQRDQGSTEATGGIVVAQKERMQYPDAMRESEAASTEANLAALRALQADASELERVRNLHDRYNILNY